MNNAISKLSRETSQRIDAPKPASEVTERVLYTCRTTVDGCIRRGAAAGPAVTMDINPVKPLPIVQPLRKVDRERRDHDSKKQRSEPGDENRDDKNKDSSIDTYA